MEQDIEIQMAQKAAMEEKYNQQQYELETMKKQNKISLEEFEKRMIKLHKEKDTELQEFKKRVGWAIGTLGISEIVRMFK